MKPKHTLILFCLAFSCCFLTSCRTSKQQQEIQKLELNSEVASEKLVTYKDTTLFAPKAETTFKIPVSQLTVKPDLNGIKKPIYYSQKNGQATAKLKIEHDTIYVTGTCDSLAIVAKIKRELQKQSSNNSKISTSETEETKVTGYTIMDILLAFFVGFVVCFLLKTFKAL